MEVQTGTLAGMIYGDVLEVFHVLCPEFKVRATVSQSQPLNAVIEIKDQETLTKFRNIVEELYQVVVSPLLFNSLCVTFFSCTKTEWAAD